MFKVGLGVGYGPSNTVLGEVSIIVAHLLCSFARLCLLHSPQDLHNVCTFAVVKDCKIGIKIPMHLWNLYTEWPRGFMPLLVVLIFKVILDPRYVSSELRSHTKYQVFMPCMNSLKVVSL